MVSETRISAQIAAYDNDGTIKLLVDMVTVAVKLLLNWLDEPHSDQFHVMVSQAVRLLPLLIELVSQTIRLVLLLIDICSMVLKVMLAIEFIINAFLDWCASIWQKAQFIYTGEIDWMHC